MRYWFAIAAALAALALWRRADIAAGVEAVYYSVTQDSLENEQRFAPAIAAAEAREGIPAGLLHRLLYQESRFRTDIIRGDTISPAGAVGIAQIVPRWHPGVNALDPDQSIDYAARYLAENFRRFGSWRLALAAYNAGPGSVAKYGGVPPFEETQEYVAQITADVVGVA